MKIIKRVLFLSLLALAPQVRAQGTGSNEGQPERSILQGQLQSTQKSLAELTENLADTQSQLNSFAQKLLREQLLAEVQAAQKVGDAAKADSAQREIDYLDYLGKTVRYQQSAILEEYNKIQRLRLDSLKETCQKLIEKSQAAGNAKKVAELKEAESFVEQGQGLLGQFLQLGKDLMTAQSNLDFKTVQSTRQKLFDLKKQLEQLQEKSTARIGQIEGTQDHVEMNI